MLVEHVVDSNVPAVRPHDCVLSAARRLLACRCGALPVGVEALRARTSATILALAIALAAARPAAAVQGHQGAGPTPPRVSFLDGEVSFWRPGAEDWAPAKVNTPLAPGDELYAGAGANFEVQLAPRAFVRGGAETQLGLETLEEHFVQFKVTAGHVAVDVRERALGRTLEVDTPQGAFTLDEAGYYRVDVDPDHTTFVTRRGGKAAMIPAGGQETDVAPDTKVVLQGNEEHAELTTAGAPAPDDWDGWNTARTDRLGEPRSARYLPGGVAGADELDRDGSWRDDPSYGPVWAPAAVPPEWAPYSTGRWMWDPYYGWTWVDDAPWGWAPFHYGRWVFVGGVWAWAPGPIVVAPAYAPALVAFFGSPGVGVSVSVGVPLVGWVALGFGEPLIPWWGPVGFIGTCWWGGWGGPHIVNNVVIERNTYVNARNVTVFRNTEVNNAVIAVHRDGFGRPGGGYVRLSSADVRRLQPVRGNLAVRPTPASLVPAAGHGIRPPEGVRTRRVVAARPPQDPRPHLRASGLSPASEPASPRLVHAGRGAPAAADRERLAPPLPPRVGHRPAGPTATARPASRQPPGGTRAPAQPGREVPPAPSVALPRARIGPPAKGRPAPPEARLAPAPASPRYAPAPGYPRPAPWRAVAPRLPAPVHHGRPRHAASPRGLVRAAEGDPGEFGRGAAAAEA